MNRYAIDVLHGEIEIACGGDTAIEQAGTLDKTKVREKLVVMKIPSILPGGELTFPAEFGQQSHAPFVVQQNQPDGSAPIIAPADSATGKGVAPNPNCGK